MLIEIKNGDFSDMPKTQGVYIVWSNNDIIYIGQTGDFRKRFAGHKTANTFKNDVVTFIHLVETFSNSRYRRDLEKLLVVHSQPKYNKTKNFFGAH